MSRRFAGLDLLRAIAIVSVMFFHAQTLSLGSPWHGATDLGWMGVDLFFVLSGFLIGRQWLKQGPTPSYAGFYRRRFFRIMPAYAVVVALYFAWPASRERRAIQPLWQFLTFTENLFIDPSHGKAFSHVWSLCVEEHFYLVLPLVAWALTRRPARWVTVLVCTAIVTVGMAWRAHVWFDEVSLLAGDANEEAMSIRWLQRLYYPTPSRLDGLVMGVGLALLETRAAATWAWLMERTRWLFGAGVLVLAASVWVFQSYPSALAAIIGYPMVAVAMGCFVASAASPLAWVERVTLPFASGIAAISYSLYLSHKIAMHLTHQWWGEVLDQNGVLAVAVYSATCLLAGLGLYFAVERPFLRLRDASSQ